MSHDVKSFFNRGSYTIISGLWMDCVEILKERGYNLEGYSPDMYVRLNENDIFNADECESWFAYLEAVYG